MMEINGIIKKLDNKNKTLVDELNKIENNCDVLHLHANSLKDGKDLLINETTSYNKVAYMRGIIIIIIIINEYHLLYYCYYNYCFYFHYQVLLVV